MTYISLLRGINVSGQKKIIMKELKALYESLDLVEVITYIQSGNVIFKSDKNEAVLIELLEKAIFHKYGFEVPVQIRDKESFNSIINALPFSRLNLEEESTRVMVTFLDVAPYTEDIEKLMSYVKEPERLMIVDKEVYLHCPNGYGKTKLTNVFIESKLKVRATTRNWRSIMKLQALSMS